jgi:hypothetical protein
MEDPRPPAGPRGPLVSASVLHLWDNTQAAIKEVRKTQQSYQQALAVSGDPAVAAQLVGKYSAFRDACKELLTAIDTEVNAMVGPNASADELELVHQELVDRAEDVGAKRTVGEALQVINERKVADAERSLGGRHGAQPTGAENILRSALNAATGAKSLAAATTEHPSLLIWDADFDQALYRLDVVNALKDGRPVVAERIEQLQEAAAVRRDAWLETVRKAGKDTELLDACQRGLSDAERAVKAVYDPLFVEVHENPAYARGVAAFAEFQEAKARGDEVALKAAMVELRAAWEAADEDAKTRNNAAYSDVCRSELVRALQAIQPVDSR